MDGLNELAPAIGGAGVLLFVGFTVLRIKREQIRARKRPEAAE